MRSHHLAIALSLLVTGCPAEQTKEDATAAEPKKDDKKVPSGELIVVAGDTFLLDGKPAGDTGTILATGKLHKVDALFEQLKEKREAWKANHPGKVFPGRAVLRVGPNAKMIVFKSAFQTTAYAGYPNLALETKEQFVDVAAVIPSPPEPQARRRAPLKTLHVQLEQDAVSLFVLQGTPARPEASLGPDLARRQALRDAEEFGLIGLLNSGGGGDPDAPTAPFGHDGALGGDPTSAGGLDVLGSPAPVPSEWVRLDAEVKPGEALADAIATAIKARFEGSAPGYGAEPGVYLHAANALSYAELRSALDGCESARRELSKDQDSPPFKLHVSVGVVAPAPEGAGEGDPPSGTRGVGVRIGATSVSGRLPPEVIQRIVRQNFGRFRLCYEDGLRNNPNLQGRVNTRFVINRDGRVSNVAAGGDIPDSQVIACVSSAFRNLTFPKPDGGIVTVAYPIVFTPGD